MGRSSPFPVRSRFNLRGRLLSGYLLCALLIVAVVAVGNRALTGLRSVWQDTAAAVATSLQQHGAAGCDVAALRQLASSAVDAADAQGVATALANCQQLAQTDRGNGITCAPALAAVRELLSAKDLQIRTRGEADACRTEFQQLLATLLHNREPSAADTRRDASVPWDSAVQQVQSAAQAGTQAVTETAQASAQELRAAQSTIESALAVADLLDAVQATVSQSVAAGDVAGEPAAAATLSSLLARIEQSLATSGNVADGENLKAAAEPLPELTARVLEARRQVSAADRQLRERACTALCTATSLIAESLGAYTPHVYAAPEAAGDELPGTFSTVVADEQDELARAAQQQAVAVQALSSAQTELQSALQALDTKVQEIVHAAAARTAAVVNASLQQLQQRVAQSANRPLETLRQLAVAHQACAAREEQAVARSSAERLQSCQTAAARLFQAQQQAAGAEQDVRRAALAVDRQLADLDTRLAAQLQTLTDRLADTQQAAGALVRGRQIGLWSFTVCAVLAAAGAGFTTYRSVVPPIQRLMRLLQDVAEGEADLTRRLPEARGDELGEMARWFNRFLERVQRVIGQIRQDATTLANAAGELSGTANDLATGADAATRQSATVSGTSAQIASHMTAMSSSTQQMTTNIKLIASAVAQMTSGIGEVAANAEQAASVAGNAARLADASNTTVGQLGHAAEEIEKVIETIQDIAEQINLLALNATIEAARAGSAGRGFAVVATEVKELAAQAAHATVDIRQRIERIQRSAHESVDSIGRIASVIRQVNDVSATIATAFEQQSTTVRAIARNVSETSAAAEQVATGVDQSAAASQRITVSIAGVDEAARETAAGANHTQTAAGELTRMAQQLQTLVRQFSV